MKKGTSYYNKTIFEIRLAIYNLIYQAVRNIRHILSNYINNQCILSHIVNDNLLIPMRIVRTENKRSQKQKQRSTKHTHRTKDRVTRTPLNIDKSWMRKGTGSAYYKWNISVVICDTDLPQRSSKSWWRPYNFRSDDFNLTKRNPWFSSYLASSNLNQGNPDMNHKLWNIVSTEKYILHMQVLL